MNTHYCTEYDQQRIEKLVIWWLDQSALAINRNDDEEGVRCFKIAKNWARHLKDEKIAI